MSHTPASTPGVALTIGAFDGVHRGHQDLVSRMVAAAKREGLAPVCVTFDPDPEVVLHPEREHLSLSTVDERVRRLGALGVSQVEVIPFTRSVAHQAPEEFMEQLRSKHDVRALWMGPDFALGKDRSGTVDMLGQIGGKLGFRIMVVDVLLHHGRPISSTWVREALGAGDVRLAAELLGRPFCLDGIVLTGMRRGRQLGFPTANVVPPQGRARPADGVYFVRAVAPGDAGSEGQVDDQSWFGVANLGARPTFGEAEPLLEAHLLDYEGDLYGARLEVCFLDQLRGVRRFASVEELRLQIDRDIATARDLARNAIWTEIR